MVTRPAGAVRGAGWRVAIVLGYRPLLERTTATTTCATTAAMTTRALNGMWVSQ